MAIRHVVAQCAFARLTKIIVVTHITVGAFLFSDAAVVRCRR